MAGERVERRLSAIFASDVVGYSRLMEADEEGTLARMNAHRREFLEPTVAQNRGRIVKRTGDGVLIEFSSAVDAARCAVDIQRGMVERNAGVSPERRIELRIGIHVGDIMIEDDDIFGDGVNIAARLEGVAQPGGICMSDDAYRQIRGKIDVNFQDSGEQELKNIARPVRVYQLRPEAPASNAKPASGLTLPDKPSIAVLAFQNMSGDTEQEFFADGIAEDIITALSKAHWLFVIARNSSFSYKGKSVDMREVGRDLGVRYVLEGSVRKAGNRVRITAQLIDATSGHHVWAERYDRALEDIFAVQDEITRSIIGAIAPGIVAAEIQRTRGKDAAQLGQWERVMRAHWHVWRFTREDCREAFHLIDEILRRDPNNALALADLSFNWHFGGVFGWTTEPIAQAMEKHGDAARRAVAADDRDATAQAALAVYELFSNRHDEAIKRLMRAIELDPNSSLARGQLGVALSFGGESDRSIAALEDAKRLSPRDYLMVVWHTVDAWSHLHAERFAEAFACAKQAIEFNPSFPDSHGIIAAAAAHLGQTAEAQAELAAFVGLLPGLTLSDPRLIRPFRRPTDRERFLAGLRKAGLEE
jgi:TolB-like protein/Flp pilus assembly protein TadD